METGRPAFGGGTTAVIFEAILNRTPVPALRVNPDLVPDLGWVTAKLLEKDRRLRYQSAAELRADLRRVKRDSEVSGVRTSAVPAYIKSGWGKRILMGAAAAIAVRKALSAKYDIEVVGPPRQANRLVGSD